MNGRALIYGTIAIDTLITPGEQRPAYAELYS